MYVLGDVTFDAALTIVRKVTLNPDCLELILELPKRNEITMLAHPHLYKTPEKGFFPQPLVVTGFVTFNREYSFDEVKSNFPKSVLLKPEPKMDEIPMGKISIQNNEFYLFIYMNYPPKQDGNIKKS